MQTETALPADAPASAESAAPAETPAPKPNGAAAIIDKLYARREKVRTVLIATIDEDNNAEIAWNSPATPSHLAHLLRMADIKLDRLYIRGMYAPAETAGPVAGVRGNNHPLPPKVQQAVAQAQARVHKAHRKKGAKERQDRLLNPNRPRG